MDIKTRRQAIADGENTYFTGKLCRNGHMTFRYVQSGTCYDCINSKRINYDSPSAKAREEKISAATEKLAVIDSMVVARFRLYLRLRDDFAMAVFAMAAMRCPSLTPADIDPSIAPTGSEPSGSALYSFRCYADDVAALRAFENQLMGGNGKAQYRAVHGAKADVYVEPAPDWSRIPRPGDFDYKP